MSLCCICTKFYWSLIVLRHFYYGWKNQKDIPSYSDSPKLTERYARSPETRMEVRAACSGWLATYEVYLVEEGSSRSLFLRTIPLEPADIELCLRQNLKFSPLGHWKCSFQMSIAPSLNKCSILNRIFWIDTQMPAFPTASLPLCSIDALNDLWSVESQLDGFRYLYRYTWCPNSKYIAFIDSFSHPNRLFEGITIFSLSDIHPHRIETLGSFRKGFSSSLTDVHFHPTKGCLMFRYLNDVYLWDFLIRKC